MLLNEGSKWDEPVRKIVRDMVTIIKNDDTGSWLLPGEVSDQNEYSFHGVPGVQLYFDWDYDYNLDEPFYLNGDYDGETDTMNVILMINPKYHPKNMYDIVADLNDIVRHEYEHHLQEWGYSSEEETGKESRRGISYYLRKDEIPAEIKGFRRIVKLRKEPVEKVMKDWFERHKNIHKFSDKQIKKLIPQLVDYYNKFYPSDK
jgi:hypothetical protein